MVQSKHAFPLRLPFDACISPDAPPQPVFTVKEEPISRGSSEQGEEEMEVESGNEQDVEAKAQGGQLSRGRNVGSSFNTLSSLTSLKPGTLPISKPSLQKYFPEFGLHSLV